MAEEIEGQEQFEKNVKFFGLSTNQIATAAGLFTTAAKALRTKRHEDTRSIDESARSMTEAIDEMPASVQAGIELGMESDRKRARRERREAQHSLFTELREFAKSIRTSVKEMAAKAKGGIGAQFTEIFDMLKEYGKTFLKTFTLVSIALTILEGIKEVFMNFNDTARIFGIARANQFNKVISDLRTTAEISLATGVTRSDVLDAVSTLSKELKGIRVSSDNIYDLTKAGIELKLRYGISGAAGFIGQVARVTEFGGSDFLQAFDNAVSLSSQLGLNISEVVNSIAELPELMIRFNIGAQLGRMQLAGAAAEAGILGLRLSQTAEAQMELTDPQRAVELSTFLQRYGVAIDPQQLLGYGYAEDPNLALRSIFTRLASSPVAARLTFENQAGSTLLRKVAAELPGGVSPEQLFGALKAIKSGKLDELDVILADALKTPEAFEKQALEQGEQAQATNISVEGLLKQIAFNIGVMLGDVLIPLYRWFLSDFAPGLFGALNWFQRAMSRLNPILRGPKSVEQFMSDRRGKAISGAELDAAVLDTFGALAEEKIKRTTGSGQRVWDLTPAEYAAVYEQATKTALNEAFSRGDVVKSALTDDIKQSMRSSDALMKDIKSRQVDPSSDRAIKASRPEPTTESDQHSSVTQPEKTGTRELHATLVLQNSKKLTDALLTLPMDIG